MAFFLISFEQLFFVQRGLATKGYDIVAAIGVRFKVALKGLCFGVDVEVNCILCKCLHNRAFNNASIL